jgi:lipoprotein-anchoring transpeptidase ErfK/SrfK
MSRRTLSVALAATAFCLGLSGAADSWCSWLRSCADRAAVAFAGNLAKIPRTHGVSTRHEILLRTSEARGSIIISARQKTLDYVLGDGRAYRYRIGVGRDGFGWSGVVKVGRKAEWPEWRPPKEMLQRDPTLPTMMPGGPLNPLGARAIYLYRDGQDSLYRIHGTSEAESIGAEISSGCFRMTNRDVMDLYSKVSVGAKVIVE